MTRALAALRSAVTSSTCLAAVMIGSSLNIFAMSSARSTSREVEARNATGSRPASAGCMASSAAECGRFFACWYHCASRNAWRLNAMMPINELG